MAKIPSKIDKYPIVSLIAEGGMGVVYKAQHPTLGKPVILKRLTLRRAGVVERFRREARLMMSFRNDHIVDVYDHFKAASSYYIVEEFVDGISLDRLIRKERYLSNEAALLVFFEACKALKHAHDQGVVHRDIKPANILISREGEVKLTDFGIASVADEDEAGLTTAGMTLGTVSYMSPEQIESSRDVDKRADVYSMGVMLYEMITGKLPFSGAFNPQTVNLIQRGRHKPIKRLNPRAAAPICRLARRAMRPARRRRYQDVGEMLRILQRELKITEEPEIQAAIKSYIGGKRLDRVHRRRGAALRVAVLAAALAGAGAAGYTTYVNGTVHELLGTRAYGALQVAVSGGDPAQVRGIVASPDGTRRPLVFRRDDDGVVRTPRVYLRAGAYELQVTSGGTLMSHSLVLQPREAQRLIPAVKDGYQVDLAVGKPGAAPARLRYRAFAQASGREITPGTRLSLLIGEEWLPWGAEAAGRLVSGAGYDLKFQQPGYLTRVVTVDMEPHQTVLMVDVVLTPRPGTLSVRSRTGGIGLLLDDSRRYVSGGPEAPILQIRPTGAGDQELVLAPGSYTLTAQRGRESVSASVEVLSDRTLAVDVAEDLTIRVGER